MTRKIIAGIILLISTGILTTAMNRAFINQLKQDRYFDHLLPAAKHDHSLYRNLLIRSDRWAYGDLYGLSYLHAFRVKLEPFRQYPYRASKPLTNKVLYITGDSYLADKTLTSAFKKFDNVIFLDLRFPFGPMVLDSTKQNYMLIELAERNLNNYITDRTSEIKWTKSDIQAKYNYGVAKNSNTDVQSLSLLTRINNVIFNPDLNRNLQLLLFDDKLLTPFKELKANLNYSLFDRLEKEVRVSTDKKRLLMAITVDTAYAESAFKPKQEKAIKALTHNLEKAGSYYRSIGFKDVYLSVVPNPVSVYDYKRMPYNHLLQRVEGQIHLKTISLYNTFRAAPQNMYYLSDSHWNPLGFEKWVGQANNFFEKKVK